MTENKKIDNAQRSLHHEQYAVGKAIAVSFFGLLYFITRENLVLIPTGILTADFFLHIGISWYFKNRAR